MSEAQQDYYDTIMSRPVFGSLPEGTPLGGPFHAWVRSPDLAASFAEYASYVRTKSDVPNRLRELAIITVGRIWSSEVEFASHSVAALSEGISGSIVESIRTRKAPEFENQDEEAVYRFAHQLTSQYQVDDGIYSAVIDQLGEKALVELIGLMGFYVMVCMTLNTFQIPVREGVPRPFPEES